MSMYEGLAKPTQENFLYAAQNQDTVHGDLDNPILNTKTTGFWAFKHYFKTLIAPINPFKLRQHSHPHGYTFHSLREHHRTKHQKPYPFKTRFEVQGPLHFDPTKDVDYEVDAGRNKMIPTRNMHINFETEKVPYICEVTKKKLDVCKLINSEQKCQNETNDFLEQCPNFALRIYRKNKLFNEKAKQIQRKEYKEAMQIGEYNRNRSLRDISKNVSYDDGMASNLRPDSMWVDDRYSDITQKDIDAVKERLQKNKKKFDYTDIKGIQHHNSNEPTYTHKPRMY